jgi:hypothetical protein
LGKNILRKYEWTNLLFFVLIMMALGVFVALVFQSYSNPNRGRSKESGSTGGVLSEVVAPGSDTCIFYLGTALSPTTRRYLSRMEIPATDDGLVSGLFGITGVESVVVDQRLIMLNKSPSARWEAIQPQAREVINKHLHMHQ